MSTKISSDLVSQLTEGSREELIDVIVEMKEPAARVASHPRSRAEEIAARKAAFSQAATPVEHLIQQVGGQVVEKAWINQTLRVRVPRRGVERLTELESVDRVDSPRRLFADAG